MIDLEIAKKMEEIKQRVLLKHGIKYKSRCLDKRKSTGKNKDLKIEAITDSFGLNKTTLANWRLGKQGTKRQRLYFLLYSLDLDVYKDLKEIVK
jgi:hypothetical protein